MLSYSFRSLLSFTRLLIVLIVSFSSQPWVWIPWAYSTLFIHSLRKCSCFCATPSLFIFLFSHPLLLIPLLQCEQYQGTRGNYLVSLIQITILTCKRQAGKLSNPNLLQLSWRFMYNLMKFFPRYLCCNLTCVYFLPRHFYVLLKYPLFANFINCGRACLGTWC